MLTAWVKKYGRTSIGRCPAALENNHTQRPASGSPPRVSPQLSVWIEEAEKKVMDSGVWGTKCPPLIVPYDWSPGHHPNPSIFRLRI
jgi:hypothetical protein